MKSTRNVALRSLFLSLALCVLILAAGIYASHEMTLQRIYSGLLFPLLRLMVFVSIGLILGQIIEETGWARVVGALAAPVFRFGNLGFRCSSAFTAAFLSGVTANSMLSEFYNQGKISRKQLFLANFVNQFPAYFLHLPTSFFIVVPLTGTAGILYFIITFIATLLRTILFLIYGHLSADMKLAGIETESSAFSYSAPAGKRKSIRHRIREKFPRRIAHIAVYVVPIYALVFTLNTLGGFRMARTWMARLMTTNVIPVEAVSMVILSFAAEFTSGFATAGALMNAGIITTKQTVLALLLGNMVAFPIRALRHQLPRYLGIFSPGIGLKLLLAGQAFRIASLVVVGGVYYYIG
ncbi:MAG: nucleoside recognition protein [Deltaproteobacteria bacterium]|nr:nucleoside recognition protein [Deltaproteobacteria bacterium]